MTVTLLDCFCRSANRDLGAAFELRSCHSANPRWYRRQSFLQLFARTKERDSSYLSEIFQHPARRVKKSTFLASSACPHFSTTRTSCSTVYVLRVFFTLHWAVPFASSLLTGTHKSSLAHISHFPLRPRARVRAWRGVGALAPAPAAHVPASLWWCRPVRTFHVCGFLALSPGPRYL